MVSNNMAYPPSVDLGVMPRFHREGVDAAVIGELHLGVPHVRGLLRRERAPAFRKVLAHVTDAGHLVGCGIKTVVCIIST